MSAHAAACRNHPEREALGVCVACRARVCAECVTKVDGVNHCAACLAARAAADTPVRARAGGPARGGSRGAWVSALLLLGFATLLVWGLVEVALPGAGG
jgi:hypothetical protein